MNTNDNLENKKFLQQSTPVSLDIDMPIKTCKKKRIHYVADPHIEPYKKRAIPITVIAAGLTRQFIWGRLNSF
jgi:hypothetical protein